MGGREEGADLLERRREADVDLGQPAQLVGPGHSLLSRDMGPGAQAADSRGHLQQALPLAQLRLQHTGSRGGTGPGRVWCR